MKRFCDTEIWNQKWFRKLSPTAKILWFYLNDNCDHAGVIWPDFEAVIFKGGVPVEEKHLAEFEDRFDRLDGGKIWLTGFIQFQYGKLSRDCRPHLPVFKSLEHHKIDLEMVEQAEEFKNGLVAYQRMRIIARDGLICLYTGLPIPSLDLAEIDHFVPKSKGGANRDHNLFVASKAMNHLRGSRDIEAFCHDANIPIAEVLKRVHERLNKGTPYLQDKDKDKEKEKEKEEGVQGETDRLALIAELHRIWQERTGFEAQQMTYERMWVDFLDASHRKADLELVIEHAKVLNKDRDPKYHAPLELGRLISDLAKFSDRLMAAKAWVKAGRPLELRKESKDETPRTIPKSEWVRNAL